MRVICSNKTKEYAGYKKDVASCNVDLSNSCNYDKRNICTHIYFLLEKHGFSAFHRIKSDELWHFYAGDPLIIYEIAQSGELTRHVLGDKIEMGQSLFCVIKNGNWFASIVKNDGEYGLAGCTVAPGFDFTDFELAEKNSLTKTYPQHAGLINSMTIR